MKTQTILFLLFLFATQIVCSPRKGKAPQNDTEIDKTLKKAKNSKFLIFLGYFILLKNSLFLNKNFSR